MVARSLWWFVAMTRQWSKKSSHHVPAKHSQSPTIRRAPRDYSTVIVLSSNSTAKRCDHRSSSSSSNNQSHSHSNNHNHNHHKNNHNRNNKDNYNHNHSKSHHSNRSDHKNNPAHINKHQHRQHPHHNNHSSDMVRPQYTLARQQNNRALLHMRNKSRAAPPQQSLAETKAMKPPH